MIRFPFNLKLPRYTFLLFPLLLWSCQLARTSNRERPYLVEHNYQQSVHASHAGVSCVHPLASKVGLYILKQGGNAVDAAIAMQLALAVVYPEAGNIGGGGFMVLRLKDGTVKALDFRETAPAAASKNMYLDEKGEVIPGKSTRGHLAAGIPGTIAGIFESMQYAKLPFKTLIQPAIDLAEGYSYRVDAHGADPAVNTMPSALDGSHPYKEGDLFVQADLAATLKRIRNKGRKEFYEGKTAKLIIAEMKRGKGIITMEDLKHYEAKWRTPHVFTYRGYTINTMPLPSGGGIILNQMLKMIEPYPMHDYGHGSTASLQLMVEAARRAYRDRATFLGDADFVPVPINKLVSYEYLEKQMADFVPGVAGVSSSPDGPTMKAESHETTHLSVVDQEGNAVAVTTTLNTAYGCGVVVGGAGFLLNNQMDDFSKKTGTRSASGGVGGESNAIAPGKRMLSSMCPTIIVKDNKLVLVTGTPGGTTIPTAVLQSVVNVIDFQLSALDAVSKPKFHHEWLPDIVQLGAYPKDTITAFENMGYKVLPYGGAYLELIKVNGNGELEIASERGAAEGY